VPQQCGTAVLHRYMNSFAETQQMFHFTFSAVIDYSVDIFCFYRRRLFPGSAVCKNKDIVQLNITSRGGNKGSGQSC
jgi:hypothetical protein